jgi:hypothetical protein
MDDGGSNGQGLLLNYVATSIQGCGKSVLANSSVR